jgi:hypothetical protein
MQDSILTDRELREGMVKDGRSPILLSHSHPQKLLVTTPSRRRAGGSPQGTDVERWEALIEDDLMADAYVEIPTD